jgi:hypothetical protein
MQRRVPHADRNVSYSRHNGLPLKADPLETQQKFSSKHQIEQVERVVLQVRKEEPPRSHCSTGTAGSHWFYRSCEYVCISSSPPQGDGGEELCGILPSDQVNLPAAQCSVCNLKAVARGSPWLKEVDNRVACCGCWVATAMS